MGNDRDLLFGALTVRADLVDDGQLNEARAACRRARPPLAEVMVGRGLITQDDRAALEETVDHAVREHGGDVAGALAATTVAPQPDAATRDDRRDAGPAQRRRVLRPRGSDDAVDRPRARRARRPLGHRRRPEQHHAPLHPDEAPRHRRGRPGLAGRDASLDRQVALKEIRPEREGNDAVWSRFLAEARITGQLEHPGIVPVYELGTGGVDSSPFYTMRFVKGRTLTESAHDYHQARAAGTATPLDFVALLNAFVGVCNAVAYAHSRGVIHRDLKGQNVVLGDFGEVIVLDWGLAKIVGDPEVPGDEPASLPQGGGGQYRTIAGPALGTPAYMPPEQAAGRLDEVDRRSDIYGLGAILYEILTGRAPFDGPNTTEILRRVIEEEPPPPRRRPVDPAGAGGGLPQGDGEEAGRPLPVGRRPGRGRPPLARRRAGLGLPRAVDPAARSLGQAAPDGRRGRGRLAGHGDCALSVGTVLIRRERNEARPKRGGQRGRPRRRRRDVHRGRREVARGPPRPGPGGVPGAGPHLLRELRRPGRLRAGHPPGAGRAYQRMGDILHKLGRNPEAE